MNPDEELQVIQALEESEEYEMANRKTAKKRALREKKKREQQELANQK